MVSSWLGFLRFRSGGGRAPSAAAILLGLLGTASHAQTFDVAADATHTIANGDVAYNPSDDEFLIVWTDAFGNVNGQFRTPAGVLSRVRHRPLLESGRLGSAVYSHARVTFKTGQNRYVVTAELIDTSAPLPMNLIVAAAFDTAGTLQWYRTLGPGPVRKGHPDVAADTFGSDCCILVVWEEGFGSIRGQRLNANGTFHEPTRTIFDGTREGPPHAMNPRAAYSAPDVDQFLVSYQVADAGTARLEARRVHAFFDVMAAPTTIAPLVETPRSRFGQRFTAGTDVAFNTVTRQFLVAWGDDGAAHARAVTTDGTAIGTTAVMGATADTPAVAAGDTNPDRRFAVSYAASAGGRPMHAVFFGDAVRRLNLITPRLLDGRERRSPASAFSNASQRFLFSFEEEEDPAVGGFDGYFDLKARLF